MSSNDRYEYTFGANGELTKRKDRTTLEETLYTYDAFGNVMSVDLPNTTDDITYLADGNGRRVAKYKGDTLEQTFLYRSQLLVAAEIADSTTTRFVYSGGANVPEYAVRDRAFYRIITDHLGSVT